MNRNDLTDELLERQLDENPIRCASCSNSNIDDIDIGNAEVMVEVAANYAGWADPSFEFWFDISDDYHKCWLVPMCSECAAHVNPFYK